MSLAKFSVKNPVLINMIMIIVFIAGIFYAYKIPKEDMPAVDFGAFFILTIYPGVSPQEVESQVTKKIEDEIYDIDNLDFMVSESSEGVSVINLQLEPDADIDKAENDLRGELDKVNDLPDDAEDPVMVRLNMREVNPICQLVIGGDFSGNAMREIAENFKEGLLDLEYMSKVEVNGTVDREIWIEGDIKKLNEYGMSFSDLQNAVLGKNLNLPGGYVKFGDREFIVRSVGEFQNISEIENLPVATDGDGRAIKIADVSTIKDTLEKRAIYSYLDQEPSVGLFLYKKSEGNIVTVIENVKKYIEQYKKEVPGLSIEIKNDTSINVKNSISTLSNNAIMGIILVFVTLLVFIGWRNALLAAIGIPFSFLLAFIIMDYNEITMNNLSLFALVLVLGMIVDDAIVVIENIHRYIEMGFKPKEAAVKGTEEIMWPVVAAILTTSVAFLPMLLMEGMMGKFMRVFPIVVTIALAASLLEALVILPSHAADYSKAKSADKKEEGLITRLLKRRYKIAVKFVLRNRIWALLLVIVMFFSSMGVLASGLIKFEFFPSLEPSTIMLQVKTPVGTKIEKTDDVVDGIYDYIKSMDKSDHVESIATNVGVMVVNYRWETATNNAELRIDLIDEEDRVYDHKAIEADLRDYLDKQADILSYEFTVVQDGPPTGRDIEIRIKGDNLDRLEYLGDVVKAELENIPGVVGVADSFNEGKKEVQVKPNPDKLAVYGLTSAEVASFVRTASYGSEISKFRGEGIDEYDIILKLKEDQIDELGELENLKITTRMGSKVALKDVADFSLATAYSSINHRDKKRIITITADNGTYMQDGLEMSRTTSEVMEVLFGSELKGTKGTLSDFEIKYPGYRLDVGGVAEEQAKSYNSLYLAFLIAVLLIYTILGTQFKSYIQPLIVMTTIPFAFIGVIAGLLFANMPFSLNTIVAFVALAGIVVNDSLVLVDFVNRYREKGIDRWNSLIEAGATRLRPIILTSVTTIFGLMPMIISTSKSAESWKPMAVSIVFGLSFATILTLFVIPIVYSIVDSLFGWSDKSRFKQRISFEEAMEKDYQNTDI